MAGIAAEEQRLQKLREDDTFFDVTLKQLKAMQLAADRASDPLDHYKEQWDALRSDLRDGKWDTQASADAINTLSNALGLTADQVRAVAWDEYIEGQDAATDAMRESEEAAEEWAKTLQDAANQVAVDLADAQIALDDMGSMFGEMARREDAIEDAFAIGNAGVETLGQITDVNDAIRDLGEFIRDEGCAEHLRPQRCRRRPVPGQDRFAAWPDPSSRSRRVRHRRPGRGDGHRRRLRRTDRRVDARPASTERPGAAHCSASPTSKPP